ncbi:MAG: hypothetical protein IPG74_08820 [Flavobacteriales bacterium]|mgnify:CR=1 FL=1|nr:hypothetical protein [Flavobacteriales bacterium]MBK7554874.1 hypothetical protein [Flavobacteriales bacterium]MBK9196556.1 hypothetical protein [Flavobacteriales bacterium]MBP6574969.1 hypothetical protein [Flavobacteriales bacterium]
MAYEPTLNTPHPVGRNYTVTVIGDGYHVPAGTMATRIAERHYALPFRATSTRSEVTVHTFTLPLLCTNSQNIGDVLVESISGGKGLGRGQVTVHDPM